MSATAAMPGAPVLEARGLTVSMRGIEVLRDLSFSVKPGEVLGLVGESGAGKSMIGRVIGRNLPGGFGVTGPRSRCARCWATASPSSRRSP